MPTRLWQWVLSVAVLGFVGGALSVGQSAPLVALGAPAAAPTAIVDDQSPNVIAPAIVVGQVATPGAAGTPGVYVPLQSDSAGRQSLVGSVAYTTPVASAATAVVTPGTTPVVAANAARKYLRCTNDSDTSIYLNFAASQPVSTGLRVNSAGGTYEMTGLGGSLYTGAIYAVATATGKTLMCIEGS